MTAGAWRAAAMLWDQFLPSSQSLDPYGLGPLFYTSNAGSAAAMADLEPPPGQQGQTLKPPIMSASFQRRILGYGDSITEGTPGSIDPWEVHGARLQAMLGPHAYYIDGGVSGNRVIGAAGLRNGTRLTFDLERQYPDTILLLGGSPDLCNDGATSAALQTDYALLLDAIVARVPSAAIKIMTVLPFGTAACGSTAKDNERLNFNAWLVAGQGGRNWPVVQMDATIGEFDATLFAGTGAWKLQPALSLDGQHPNEAGQYVIANAWWQNVFGGRRLAAL
jgi:lysophospholipase L1-like esterase